MWFGESRVRLNLSPRCYRHSCSVGKVYFNGRWFCPVCEVLWCCG